MQPGTHDVGLLWKRYFIFLLDGKPNAGKGGDGRSGKGGEKGANGRDGYAYDAVFVGWPDSFNADTALSAFNTSGVTSSGAPFVHSVSS
jgi:hypothetical protein